MSIESDDDLAGVREAGRVTIETLDALQAHVAAGITTRELDAIAAEMLKKNGARSAPAIVYGFPGTVLISVNDEVVHGIPGARRLRKGDLVSLDVTVEKDGFIADAARSVVVGGAGPQLAHQLIDVANAALREGLIVARAGARVNAIGRAVQTEVERRGFRIVHGLTGHGVGRTIHEEPQVPNFYDRLQRDVLTEGLVLTIEPMICAGSPYPVQDGDGWTIRTRDGSLAAHCEHTLVITNGQPMILAA
jgi:methionyl aminopeptidase